MEREARWLLRIIGTVIAVLIIALIILSWPMPARGEDKFAENEIEIPQEVIRRMVEEKALVVKSAGIAYSSEGILLLATLWYPPDLVVVSVILTSQGSNQIFIRRDWIAEIWEINLINGEKELLWKRPEKTERIEEIEEW